MDTRTFALSLMEKPASYYYGVLWNKLYRREILVQHQLSFVSELHWSEDLVFNLQYIQHAERFYAMPSTSRGTTMSRTPRAWSTPACGPSPSSR